MRHAHLLAASGIAASTTASLLNQSTGCPTITCNFFKQNFPNITYLPDDVGYTAENEG